MSVCLEVLINCVFVEKSAPAKIRIRVGITCRISVSGVQEKVNICPSLDLIIKMFNISTGESEILLFCTLDISVGNPYQCLVRVFICRLTTAVVSCSWPSSRRSLLKRLAMARLNTCHLPVTVLSQTTAHNYKVCPQSIYYVYM